MPLFLNIDAVGVEKKYWLLMMRFDGILTYSNVILFKIFLRAAELLAVMDVSQRMVETDVSCKALSLLSKETIWNSTL